LSGSQYIHPALPEVIESSQEEEMKKLRSLFYVASVLLVFSVPVFGFQDIVVPLPLELPNVIGVALGAATDYEGSDDYMFGMLPAFNLQFDNRYIRLIGTSLGVNVLNHEVFEFGPSALLGFEITKLTIIISALGVGIGFGLQGVVNNFVCGFILLFEGSIRVGDTVEIGGQWAEIIRIGLRSTTVMTFDQADLIIPNADLVNNQVINWTLSNRRVRLKVPVGVAYGSDVPLVIETLMACAGENEMVSKIHTPQVIFLNFGESSLDFELRVWILDADYRLNAKSELHQEIDRRFREANIEIAFPQRDLHLRSIDESVILQPPETIR
jgi:hypothetical protein